MRFADPALCEMTFLGVVTPLSLAAVPEPAAFSTHEGIPTDSIEVAELEHQRIAALRARLEAITHSFTEAGFRVTTDIEIGRPAPSILKVAEEGGYDLVVMGSRGLGAIGGKLLGSVGEEVSRHAAATLVAP